MKTKFVFLALATLVVFSAFVYNPEPKIDEGAFIETVEYNPEFQQHFIDELKDLDQVHNINAFELENGNIKLSIEGSYQGQPQNINVEMTKQEYKPKRPRCSCLSNNKAYVWYGDRYVCTAYCS